MKHLASLCRVATGTVVFVALGSACGGKSFEPVGTNDDGGSAGAGATSSQSGSPAVAGKPSVGGIGTGGGSSSGGATPVGGATSTAGTTGAGGASPGGEACTATSDPGPCSAYIPSWYHDASTGECRRFVYGGCGGNANRYASLSECQKACRGIGLSYDSCTQASDCLVAGNGCCGVCDSPSLTKHDFVAYNKKYQGLECSGPAGDVACPGCPELEGGFIKYFVPNCVQNECIVVDLRDPEFTACMTDDDCTYRLGTGCCQSCSAADAIPLRKDAQVEPLLCAGTGPVACAPCAPPGPIDSPVPVCNAGGRCEVRFVAF